MRVPQCNPEIWKINLSSFQHTLQTLVCRKLLHLMKASYAIVNACDELIVAEETARSNKLLTMLVDSVALLGLLTIKLNALRRDLMKHELSDHLKQLAKGVPSDSTNLFWDNIQKQINQIAATNTTLKKSFSLSHQIFNSSAYADYYVMLLFNLTLIMHHQPGILTLTKK